jgi:hypothetical protein
MQTLGKILGLALLEIVAWFGWFSSAMLMLGFSGIPMKKFIWAYLVVAAIPVMLLGSFLASLWGLWRANWLARAAAAVIYLVLPVVLSMSVFLL